MATSTTTYLFQKPASGDLFITRILTDMGDNLDDLDDLLDGTTPLKLNAASTGYEWDDNAAAALMTLGRTSGQLALPKTGSGGGLLIGADAQWYRSAANTLRTPDSVTIDDELTVGATKWAGANHAHAAANSGGTIVKTLWLQPHSTGGTATLATNLNSYGATSVGSAAAIGYANYACALPSNFNAISKAVLVVISAETGNMVWGMNTDFAADGEAHQLNSDAITATTRAMTANQMDELDISAAFTGVAANDRIGISFNRDGTDAADTITTLYVLGVLIEYT